MLQTMDVLHNDDHRTIPKTRPSFCCVTVSGRHSQPCLYLQTSSYKTQVSQQEKSLGYLHYPIFAHTQLHARAKLSQDYLEDSIKSFAPGALQLPAFIYPIRSMLCQVIYRVTARYGQELLRNRTSGTAAEPLFWRRSLWS